MLLSDVLLSSFVILLSLVVRMNSIKVIFNTTRAQWPTSTSNQTLDETSATAMTTAKTLLIQGQEMIQDRLHRMNQGTLIRAAVIFASLTCLVLIFVAIKTYLLRRRYQTRRYKLLSNATRMEEPLFTGNDDDDPEDKEDDTLFIRK